MIYKNGGSLPNVEPEVETQALFWARVPCSVEHAKSGKGEPVFGNHQGPSELLVLSRVNLSEFCSNLLTISVCKYLQFSWKHLCTPGCRFKTLDLTEGTTESNKEMHIAAALTWVYQQVCGHCPVCMFPWHGGSPWGVPRTLRQFFLNL